MKNFNIQTLGLVMMPMLIVMISTNPVPDSERVRQLKLIHQYANETNQTASDEWVIQASGSNGAQTCVKDINHKTVFFCLAEKSLGHTKHKNIEVYNATDKLRHQLHQYRKLTGIDCELDQSKWQKLPVLLTRIMHCVDYELKGKN